MAGRQGGRGGGGLAEGFGGGGGNANEGGPDGVQLPRSALHNPLSLPVTDSCSFHTLPSFPGFYHLYFD